jgi:hypothetical protein
MTYNKARILQHAHRIARITRPAFNSYAKAFAAALSTAWANAKSQAKWKAAPKQEISIEEGHAIQAFYSNPNTRFMQSHLCD